MTKPKLILVALCAFVLSAGIWGLCALWSYFGPSRVPTDWSFTSSSPAFYRTGYDKVADSQEPKSVVIRSLLPLTSGWTELGQKCDATPYRGQRVRLTVWIKTKDLPKNSEASVLFCANDQAGGELARGGTVLKGTKEWRQYAAVLDIPEEASTLFYGMALYGAGTAWFNDLQIKAVPETVPLKQWKTPDISAMPSLNLGPSLQVDPEDTLKSFELPEQSSVSLEESETEGRVLKFDISQENGLELNRGGRAEDFTGKKLRLRARLKTAKLKGNLSIQFMSQSRGTSDFGYFMAWSEPISGTSDWKDYDCVIPIRGMLPTAKLSIVAAGESGSVFLKSVDLSLADDSAPVGEGFDFVECKPLELPVVDSPMNLDFSK